MRTYSAFSETASCGPYTGGAAQPTEFLILALLAGFSARLTPDPRGWFLTYGAREVWLKWAPDAPQAEESAEMLYRVHDVQNLTLQKTVLELEEHADYRAAFYLVDDDERIVYESEPQTVTTLSATNEEVFDEE